MFSDDYIGHANPLIGIAQRLMKAGHCVNFFGPGELAQHVTRYGCTYFSMPCLSPRVYSREVMESHGRGSCVEGENAVARRTAEILEAARTIQLLHQPEVAIFDAFMLCLLPAFAMTGMKCVAVSIAPLLTPDSAVPPYTSGVVPNIGEEVNPEIAAAWREQEIVFETYEKYSEQQEGRHGWSNRSLVEALSRASGFPIASELRCRHVPHDLNFKSVPEVVVHAEEFEFPRSCSLSNLGAYLGPCTTSQVSADIEVSGNGPLILCQLGTVACQQDEAVKLSYRKILQIVSLKKNWRAIFAVSSPSILEEMKATASVLGDRVLFTQWIDQADALLQADVMISNAGDSSVKEAILASTPILAMPRHFDQHGVAARVGFHRLGVIAAHTDCKEVLERKICSLLDDVEYRENVEAMRLCFLRYDDEKVCVRVFEAIAGGETVKFADQRFSRPRNFSSPRP